MVSMFVLSAVDRRFKARSGQTKQYKIGVHYSTKHAALRNKSKDLLTGAICLLANCWVSLS